MLKKIAAVTAVLIIAAVCLGFNQGPRYNVVYDTVTIGSGMTLWEIADAYYLEGKAKSMCFEEYLYNVRHDPKNEKLTANGRMLQPGDVVYVPLFQEK